MATEKIEQAIEDTLIKALDQELSPEQIQALESKVVTVRKLSE